MIENYVLCDRSKSSIPREGWEIVELEASVGVVRGWRRASSTVEKPTIELDHGERAPSLTLSRGIRHSDVIPQNLENLLLLNQGVLDANLIDPINIFSDFLVCSAVESGKQDPLMKYYFGKMRWHGIERMEGLIDFSESLFEELDENEYLKALPGETSGNGFEVPIMGTTAEVRLGSFKEYTSRPFQETLGRTISPNGHRR